MAIKTNDTLQTELTKTKTAFLIITYKHGKQEFEPEKLLDELTALVDTIGLEILGHELVHLREIHPRFLTGTGKTDEIIEKAKNLEADCIVFDDDLSPTQQRNWEELSGLCVIDRREVILDIFTARAKTKEAVLQVDLARLEYSLPRLKRAWTHLSRQRGGIWGTKGEGETQLEIDRRVVMNKITRLKKDLEKIEQSRDTMRRLRQTEHMPIGSIIGYTNAGKSSLLNALSGSDVFVEDKLFATLDSTTRRIKLEGGNTVLLSDTVGFIRKLPHDLIETFKSTLEETKYADFLIHVIDASNPENWHHYQTTMSVMEEIGVKDKPMLTVFNKTDLCTDEFFLLPFHDLPLQSICVSTKTGEGLPGLLTMIEELLYKHQPPKIYRIPVTRYDLVALIHRKGKVVEESHEDDMIIISALLPAEVEQQMLEYT